MPARRAGTILFAIESRTARLVARSRTAMATYLTERAEADREREFLASLAAGREAVRVTIQDLERFADDWAAVVPPDAETRAAIARLLSDKHRFRRDDVPRLRAALGLDEPAVAAAFERQRATPLEAVYAARSPTRERLRWWRSRAAARLEALPPFWMAFALTLTETVGAGVLALPIAFAALGAPAAIGLLIVFGLVNILTVAALVEGITRDGSMRYGSAYFGRLVGEYLGRPGATVVTLAMVLLNAIGLVALMIGFGSALAGASGIPAGVWAALLALAIVGILRRESLDATVGSVLVVGGLNIALLVAISLVALLHLDVANLSPAAAGGDATLLGLVFGTALMAFFGHTSAGNAAKVVLRRDPSGRALLWGNVAALAAAIGLYVLSVGSTLGAVPAAALVGYGGTALTPLGEVTGPPVVVLGSVFVVLAMGLSALHISLGLFNQVGEWLPVASGPADRRRQSVVKALPVIGLLILLELLLLSGGGSFTGSLSFLGTVTVPILGGLMPMLLVLAARRRGEFVPGTILGLVGHPVTVVLVSGLFLVGLLTHALVIWTQPIERLAALVAALAFVGVAVWAVRARAFGPRTVVELRVDEGAPDRASLSVVAAGRPWHPVVERATIAGTTMVDGTGVLGSAEDLASLRVDLAGSAPGALRVWSHRVGGDGDSARWPLDVLVERPGTRYLMMLDNDGVADDASGPDAVVTLRRAGEAGDAMLQASDPYPGGRSSS
jgi:amino acid permease